MHMDPGLPDPPETASDDDFVTIAQAADALGLPKTTVQGWVNRGRLRKYKRGISAVVFVRLSEVTEKAAIRPVGDEEGGDD